MALPIQPKFYPVKLNEQLISPEACCGKWYQRFYWTPSPALSPKWDHFSLDGGYFSPAGHAFHKPMLTGPDPLVVFYAPCDGTQEDLLYGRPSLTLMLGWQACSSLDPPSSPSGGHHLCQPPVTWQPPSQPGLLVNAENCVSGHLSSQPTTSLSTLDWILSAPIEACVCLNNLLGHWPFPYGLWGL